MARVSDFRIKKFIKLCASNVAPYRAAIDAGYSEKYAKTNAHIMLEKYKNEIDKVKKEVQKELQKEVKYTVQDSIEEFNRLKKIALEYAIDGKINSIQSAIKCEENIAKLLGLYEVDNNQKNGINNIIINREIIDANNNI